MILLRPTDQQIAQALAEAEVMGKLNKWSFTEGKRAKYGLLGEIVLADYLGVERAIGCIHYDMIFNGCKIEAKTKWCTCTPQPNWLCSIPSYNTTQECDVYLFMRADDKMKRLWIFGKMKKEDFFDQAFELKKGEIDPDSLPHKPWPVKEDCWNVPVSAVSPLNIKKLKNAQA